MEKKENDQNDYLWMGGFQAIFTSLFEFFFIEKFQNIDKYKTENKKSIVSLIPRDLRSFKSIILIYSRLVLFESKQQKQYYCKYLGARYEERQLLKMRAT